MNQIEVKKSPSHPYLENELLYQLLKIHLKCQTMVRTEVPLEVFPPTQTDTTTKLSLFHRILVFKFKKLIMTGEMVVLDDVKGNIPSVLKGILQVSSLRFFKFPKITAHR